MNVELLARNAIAIIKSKWGLPKNGFIAGGSIANLIWEEVSGVKAIINDIDVFIFKELLAEYSQDKNEYIYSFKQDEENLWYDDYSGIRFFDKAKNFYSIIESTKDDMFNFIDYKSNTDNPEIIVNSFDINCTAVGYSIEEDKVYWTKEFERFLINKKLKVTNLKTPCHTAIRIIKKSDELNIELDTFELKILQHSVGKYKLGDIYKVRFQDRYQGLFNKYSSILSKYFCLEFDQECVAHVLRHYKKKVNLWTLKTLNDEVFSDTFIQQISKGDDFLFYIRNIYNNPELLKVWGKLKPLFLSENYVDEQADIDDIQLLSKLIRHAPKSIIYLRGYKLSEQIKIIKNVFNVYKDDLLIGISVLEHNKIDPDLIIDDSTALLLELSVRREILEDTKGKVKAIFE